MADQWSEEERALLRTPLNGVPSSIKARNTGVSISIDDQGAADIRTTESSQRSIIRDPIGVFDEIAGAETMDVGSTRHNADRRIDLHIEEYKALRTEYLALLTQRDRWIHFAIVLTTALIGWVIAESDSAIETSLMAPFLVHVGSGFLGVSAVMYQIGDIKSARILRYFVESLEPEMRQSVGVKRHAPLSEGNRLMAWHDFKTTATWTMREEARITGYVEKDNAEIGHVSRKIVLLLFLIGSTTLMAAAVWMSWGWGWDKSPTDVPAEARLGACIATGSWLLLVVWFAVRLRNEPDRPNLTQTSGANAS